MIQDDVEGLEESSQGAGPFGLKEVRNSLTSSADSDSGALLRKKV